MPQFYELVYRSLRFDSYNTSSCWWNAPDRAWARKLLGLRPHRPRVRLVGYGPSASTIGDNRAGGAAAREPSQRPGLIRSWPLRPVLLPFEPAEGMPMQRLQGLA
jgi:hypothetical protein